MIYQYIAKNYGQKHKSVVFLFLFNVPGRNMYTAAKAMGEKASSYSAAVMIAILYTSSASQPLDRSLIGALSPSRIGP